MDDSDKLCVVWHSADPETAESVAFMYPWNAKVKGWFKEVTFVIWGPSAKTLAESPSLQAQLRQMMEAGLKVQACVACARMFGVEGELADLGIDVRPMGEPLSQMLKQGWKVITF